MKIAFIGQKGIPASIGGVERHVEAVSSRLAEAGHQVSVYTRPNYTPKELKKFRGVNLISAPSIATKHLDAISHTFFCILDARKRKFDIVHFHSIGPSFLIWLFKLVNPDVPVVATFHSQDYFHKKWNLAAKVFLRISEKAMAIFSDCLITVSKELKEYTSKKYKIFAEYIPNGVEVYDTENESDVMSEWGITKKEYILYTGRIIGHKGLHYLIEAFEKAGDDLYLVIVGDGFFSDSYVKKIKKISKNNPKIIFTGTLSGKSLRSLYENAKIYVQPSESEGLSLSIIEAMSFKVPVLVSDIPENLEIVGDFGYSFKNKNAQNLAEKLNYIKNNYGDAIKLSQMGYINVLKSYEWGGIAKKIENLYNDVIFIKNAKKHSLAKKIANKLASFIL